MIKTIECSQIRIHKDSNETMNAAILKKYYQNLQNDLDNIMTAVSVPEELSQTVFTSEWIRIFLTGNIKDRKVSIHIEISYPRTIRLGNDSVTVNGIKMGKTDYLKAIIENQIIHLEYLIRLYDEGFALGFIGEEGTWFATKRLDTEPDEELCELLNQIPDSSILNGFLIPANQASKDS